MKASEVLEFARAHRRNQTEAESYFWSRVRNRKLKGYKFTRQFVIQYEDQSYFIADFHCYHAKLIIEIDGKIHLRQKKYDEMREEILKEMGYSILRFRNEDVLKKWVMVEKKLLSFLNSPLPLS